LPDGNGCIGLTGECSDSSSEGDATRDVVEDLVETIGWTLRYWMDIALDVIPGYC